MVAPICVNVWAYVCLCGWVVLPSRRAEGCLGVYFCLGSSLECVGLPLNKLLLRTWIRNLEEISVLLALPHLRHGDGKLGKSPLVLIDLEERPDNSEEGGKIIHLCLCEGKLIGKIEI